MVPKSFTLNREPHIKVGDIVTITGKPIFWASAGTLENPMDLKFPQTGRIISISELIANNYRRMAIEIDGTNYGFSYDKDCYHLFENKERRVKELLRKLNEV